MSGYHGTVGAPGVRPTVCPEPLRRALTLAGLLTGILFTVWLASAVPAHSAELSGPGNPLQGGLVESTGNLGGSIGGTVTTVGEHATRAVDGASEAARAVEAETAVPVQQVREAVRETSLPRPEPLPELVVPVSTQVTEPAPEPENDDVTPAEAAPTGQTRTMKLPEGQAAVEQPAAEALTAAQGQIPAAAQERDVPADERSGDTDVPRGAETVTSIPGGTSPATSGGTPAPVVAGFLPVTGAPAPAPGLFEAARHVLRSAPADSADEPTFSPD